MRVRQAARHASNYPATAWIERLPGSRAVGVTEVGHRALQRKLGVVVPAG